MGHQLRHIQPGTVYEVVRRTRYGRFAFVPTPELVDALQGLLAEAQRRWPHVQIHQCEWLTNHLHALLSMLPPYSANAMAGWLNYVMGESAKLAIAMHGLRGPIWEKKRCRLIPILDDEALRERTKYIMGQATAAGLVAKPGQWPGVSTCDALCGGDAITGHLSTAALRRQAARAGISIAKLTVSKELTLDPLPTHADWSPQQRQAWYRQIRHEVIEDAKIQYPDRRYPPPERYTQLDPNTEKALDETPPPQCWAGVGNQAAREKWQASFRAFTDAWREALRAWLDGAKPCFPLGGWIPFRPCFATDFKQLE